MPRNDARGGHTRGPSIRDVARLAEVSAQTVSRVSTGSDAVRQETRDRVLRAMEQLGYSPNHAARALRDGRFGSIGLLAHRFDRTGESMITDAVLRAAQAEGYGVTLVTVQDAAHDGWTPAANRLRHQTVDGLIIIRSEGHSTEQLALPTGMPVAVSDSRVHGVYPCVVSDELNSSRMAVDHLLSLGHRTVHYVAGPEDSEPARLRRAGWRTGLVQAGAEVPEPHVGDWTADSGYTAGTALAADPEVTAIACANDETAFGVLAALHEAGRRVPEDVSVIGFDDVSLSRFTQPPLTTVKQHFTTIGTQLFRLVMDQIGTPRTAEIPDVTVPTELVLRASTAPPRSASVSRAQTG
ncbi:LacI family DNA-binding transcriptional regulator [Demequina sp. NBRC 110057]|uniref:LacI family DNA-binding transcriptional regulator n=1 Tax=Demequina sp. NBRC 110057 TaxID=1570346 RepID=UPI000A060E90|nr:LacI family DNA-binding transcriptional regulator [Demequina sp. NBRC 110057]